MLKAAFIWSKYSKNSNTMKYDFYCNIIKKYNLAYSCDIEAEFSAAITWVFSVTFFCLQTYSFDEFIWNLV